MRFLLGIHQPEWLERVDVPSMVSFRRLAHRTKLPRALSGWAQDSGGFTELGKPPHCYRTSAREYARRTRLHADEVGSMEWAAVQDWMCEDDVLRKTGASIVHHQVRTLESYLDLRELAPDLPWLPVLQGQDLDDYRRHLDLYDRAGIELRSLPLVGVGTVCRRQHTMVAVRLLQELRLLGLRQLHGFGLKVTSLLRLRHELASADSMAWSADGRYPQGGRCRRTRNHDKCANCLEWALRWRGRLIDRLEQGWLWNDDEPTGDTSGLALPGQLALPRDLVVDVRY